MAEKNEKKHKGRKPGSRKRGIVTPDNPFGLHPKYMLLVDLYFENGFNANQATFDAGFKNGKDKKNHGYDHRLFRRPDVQQEIARRQRLARTKQEIRLEDVQQNLYAVATCNWGDVLLKLRDADNDLSVLTPEERFAIGGLKTKTSLVGRGDKKEIVLDFQTTQKDALRAAEILSRQFGWFNDSLDVTGELSFIEEIYKARPSLKKTAETEDDENETGDDQEETCP